MTAIALRPSLILPRIPWNALIVGLLRCVFFLFLVSSVASAIDLGTSTFILSFSVIFGVLTATALAFTRLTTVGFLMLGLSLYVLQWIGFWLLGLIPVSWLPSIFSIFDVQTHFQLCMFSFGLAAVSTWIFWRFQHAVTLEVLALLGFVLYQVSDYRNFNFRVSQTIGSIAWNFGISHLTALIVIGVLVVLGLALYLYCATLPGRPLAGPGKPETKVSGGRTMIALGLGSLLVLSAYIYVVSNLTFHHFSNQTFDKNGVGMGADEKMSPLDFHSALGGTNQPSALVRLEGDYPNNPFSPMLYLREAALSEYDGEKIVKAERIYDTDVSNTTPEDSYVGPEDSNLVMRTPMVQSVYMLAQHKTAFAIDYPVSIDLLKNPNPKRFKAAYRAYSIAPSFSLDELRTAAVGDTRWQPDDWKHYVTPNPDVRYKNLAEQITQGVESPIQKAFAIVEYLNKNAIYTLTPGHDVKEDEDPVVPFLFGDMRGYCVHFAHATVYLLRALGVPSRIGTGYLTDLSQAKDGHILLRMSDRHAWAEVYVDQKGWMPFDTRPEQVESHAETPVDMKLLEELMNMLGPDEEILPKEIGKDEKGLTEPRQWSLPGRNVIIAPFLLLLASIIVTKVLLLYAWAFARTPETRLKWTYKAMLTRLYGLGVRRSPGETRLEFQHRVSRELGSNILASTEQLGRLTYAEPRSGIISSELESAVRSESLSQWNLVKRWKRFWAMLNPAAVFFAWLKGKW